MPSHEDHSGRRWLSKALCRRYAFVHLAEFQMSGIENGVARRRSWCWAFAMFAADEFEVMGAWRRDTDAVEPIIESLRDRGVLSIRVMSNSEAMGCVLDSWAAAQQTAELRVLRVVSPQSVSEKTIEGVSSAAIRSALNTAARIHDSLVRRAASRAPFPSAAVASEFVAGWLQKADRRLYEALRLNRLAVTQAA